MAEIERSSGDMKIKFRNDHADTLNPQIRRWVKSIALITGILFLLLSATRLFCLLTKPKFEDAVIQIAGNKYWQQMITGAVF